MQEKPRQAPDFDDWAEGGNLGGHTSLLMDRLISLVYERAKEIGLNYAQMRYVQDAIPGNEQEGYSQALLGVDGEGRGMEIQALPKEKQVIDFDPTRDAPDVSAIIEPEDEPADAEDSVEGLPVADGGSE